MRKNVKVLFKIISLLNDDQLVIITLYSGESSTLQLL